MSRHGENIYKRKDGRYEGRYVKGRKPNGQTMFGYVYGYQYRAVRNQLLTIKAKQLDNKGFVSGHYTLTGWMEHWLESEKRDAVKPSSYQTYLRNFRVHIQPGVGYMKLSAIDAGVVQEFLQRLHECGCAGNTVRAVYRLLSAAMECAEKEGLILRNPCRKVSVRDQERTEQRVLNRSEQLSIARAARADADIAPILGLYAGMRLGEICGLKWTDIDLERNTIFIRRTAQRIASDKRGPCRTEVVIGTPKSRNAVRRIPIPDFVAQLLRERLAAAQSEFVIGECNQPADPRTIQRRFKRLVDRLGIPDAHFHTLRHTFATRLLEMGVDVKTVSLLLGHSSPQITLNFYGHSLWEHQCAAMQKLADLQL